MGAGDSPEEARKRRKQKTRREAAKKPGFACALSLEGVLKAAPAALTPVVAIEFSANEGELSTGRGVRFENRTIRESHRGR